MARGQNPLMLMMALSLPGAANALGLGEIHVDSALNEPLAAEIDIVGATAEELMNLRASIANRETFLRFGADRPAFLNTATFKVAHDAKGRPVLAIRSSESFTEPLVNMVVDLRWDNGELIRQYTLLLDPAGFPTAVRSAEALPTPATAAALPAPVSAMMSNSSISSAPTVKVPATRSRELGSNTSSGNFAAAAAANAPVSVTAKSGGADTTAAQFAPTDSTPSGMDSTRTTTHIKVGTRATLRGVAWRVGARSKPDLQRLMLAIFRANPSAFQGNINIMKLGALLTIPSAADVEAISPREASREIHAQMNAWRDSLKPALSARAAASSPAPSLPVPVRAPVDATPASKQSAASTPAATVSAAAPVVAAPVVAAPVVAAPSATVAVPAATPTAAPAAATASDDASDAALKQRIQSLEASLHDVQSALDRDHDKMLNLQAQARYAETVRPTVAAAPAPATLRKDFALWIGAGGTLLAAALAALYWKLRRKPAPTDRYASTPLIPEPMPAVATMPDHAPVKAEVRTYPKPDRSPRRSEPEPQVASLEASVGGLSAAALRDELAAKKLREEIAAAWATPTVEVPSPSDVDIDKAAEAIFGNTDVYVEVSDETGPHGVLNGQALGEIDSTEADTITIENSDITEADTVRLATAAEVTASLSAGSLAADLMAAEAQAGSRDTTVAYKPSTADTLNAVGAATVSMPSAAATMRVDANSLDFNFSDLDMSEHHVHMPSAAHETPEVTERRTSLADVLRQAIEKEPDRRDLRMKLLETYYAAAATNRQAFLDVVEKLADERNEMSGDEWEKIASMGRQIASDTQMFTEEDHRAAARHEAERRDGTRRDADHLDEDRQSSNDDDMAA